LASFGLGFLLYLSGGNSFINEANTKISILRTLRDSGTDTVGESITRYAGKYFDKKRLRDVTRSDTYIRYAVANGTFEEVHTDKWGGVSGDNINVRYLPSDPKVAYYTTNPHIIHAINDEIRPYIYTRLLVWAVVLIPVSFGALMLLVAIGPQKWAYVEKGAHFVVSLMFVILSIGGAYVYLAWYR